MVETRIGFGNLPAPPRCVPRLPQSIPENSTQPTPTASPPHFPFPQQLKNSTSNSACGTNSRTCLILIVNSHRNPCTASDSSSDDVTIATFQILRIKRPRAKFKAISSFRLVVNSVWGIVLRKFFLENQYVVCYTMRLHKNAPPVSTRHKSKGCIKREPRWLKTTRTVEQIVERKKSGASKHSQVTVSGYHVPQQTPTDESKTAVSKATAKAKK